MSLLAPAEKRFRETFTVGKSVGYANDPKWALVLAEAHNRIGFVRKAANLQQTPNAPTQMRLNDPGLRWLGRFTGQLLARERPTKSRVSARGRGGTIESAHALLLVGRCASSSIGSNKTGNPAVMKQNCPAFQDSVLQGAPLPAALKPTASSLNGYKRNRRTPSKLQQFWILWSRTKYPQHLPG